jgi:N-methylhydantoinase B
MRDFAMPSSVFGGKSPKPSKLTRYSPHGQTEEIDCFRFFDLKAGDILEVYKAAGAGFGDPFGRDIDRAQQDVKNELVSIRGAKEEYGVVIDSVTLEVDIEATEKLRRERNK